MTTTAEHVRALESIKAMCAHFLSDEGRAALIAAIAAMKATEWLPIESAPTARRQFFLAFVGGVVVMAHHFDREIWQAGEPNGNFDCYPIHPTHWMHLPQPPKESE